MNEPRKLVATSISSRPPTSEITALMLTAMARGSLTPMVWAVKPAEYMERLLISSMPTIAVSRYGTASQVGSRSPRKETGSAASARPGEATAITAPISTIGTITRPAPETVTPTIFRPEAECGR